MIKKYTIILLVFVGGVFASQNVNGQNPLSLYWLDNIPQSNMVNPAMAPRANGYFGFPAVNNVYSSFRTDLSVNDLIQPNGTSWVTPNNADFDFGPLYGHIGKAANVDVYQVISPLMLGFRTKQGYVNFGITAKANANLAIPKDFFSIIENGFPSGSKYDFSPTGINMSYYHEVSMGYSHQLTSKLRLGAHAKVLFGIANINTNIDKMSLETSRDEWILDMKGAVYSSIPEVEIKSDENGVPDSIGVPDFDLKTVLDATALNFSNPGFAIDLGAVYDLNEAWTFSASITDLGFIKWNDGLNSFHFDGKYSWQGLSINANNIDSLDVVMDEVVDSIKSSINLEHQTGNAYSTFIGPQIFLGAKYNVNHYFSLGALSRTTLKKNNFQQEFNVSANLNLYHFLTATVNYTLALDGRNNVGFGLGMRTGPLQFYMSADYLPYEYRDYYIPDGDGSKAQIGPADLQAFNIMFGLNILFGANGFRDDPMIKAYDEF